MAKTKKDKKREALISKLTKAGLQISGEETIEELKELEANLEAGEDSAENNTESDTKVETEKGKVFVYVKFTCYVNDTQRVSAGLYQMKKSEVPARLSGNKSSVEIFEDSIGGVDLARIAKAFGVNDSKYRGKDGDEKLLEALLTKGEMKLF